MNNPFDKKLLSSHIIKPSVFKIGIDTYDKNVNAYCLTNVASNTVVLSKVIRDENDFNTEVYNLAKYFNAEIIKENH